MDKVGRLAQSGELPLQEEVTGSNLAPTRVFQKSLHIYTQKTPIRHHFCRVSFGNIHLVMN